jgi:hypothetical protein
MSAVIPALLQPMLMASRSIFGEETRALNRPGFVGGSHFQIGWSRYEQNNEQILP